MARSTNNTTKISQANYSKKVKEMKSLLREAEGTARIRANNFLIDNDFTTYNEKTFDSIMNDLRNAQPKKSTKKSVAKKSSPQSSATNKRKPAKSTKSKSTKSSDTQKRSRTQKATSKKSPKREVAKKTSPKNKVSSKQSDIQHIYPREVDSFTYQGYEINIGDEIFLKLENGKEVKRNVTQIVQTRRNMAKVFFDLPKNLAKTYSNYLWTHPEEITEVPDGRIKNPVDKKVESKKSTVKKASPKSATKNVSRKAATSTKKTAKKSSPRSAKTSTTKRSSRRRNRK